MSDLISQNLNMIFKTPKGETVHALKDVSFTLKKGELLTVLGPSGCGKTTLLNITAGFLRPTSGKITLNNNEIDGPGVERGMVFQQGALFEWLTVAENVNFGLRMKKEDPEVTAKKVDEWLDIVGLKGFGNTPTYQLSGGMQQRVALARCLINDPDLILMDEPLGALDALTREKMQSLVLKIWKETGKTIILITHSVEEALLLGERLYVMAPRPGRIHKEYNLPFEPRDYQMEAVETAIKYGRQLLLSPTASGKSLIIYLLARWYNKKTVIIVPTTSLVEQMSKDFVEYGYDKEICKIYSGQPVFDSDITITTWQSFSKAPKNVLESFDVVFGDEAHLFKANVLKGILEKMKKTAIRFGTTGTLDGSECHRLQLEGLFGPVKKVISTKELIEKRHIPPRMVEQF